VIPFYHVLDGGTVIDIQKQYARIDTDLAANWTGSPTKPTTKSIEVMVGAEDGSIIGIHGMVNHVLKGASHGKMLYVDLAVENTTEIKYNWPVLLEVSSTVSVTTPFSAVTAANAYIEPSVGSTEFQRITDALTIQPSADSAYATVTLQTGIFYVQNGRLMIDNAGDEVTSYIPVQLPDTPIPHEDLDPDKDGDGDWDSNTDHDGRYWQVAGQGETADFDTEGNAGAQFLFVSDGNDTGMYTATGNYWSVNSLLVSVDTGISLVTTGMANDITITATGALNLSATAGDLTLTVGGDLKVGAKTALDSQEVRLTLKDGSFLNAIIQKGILCVV
jgi:hypothetical protein